MKLYYWPSKALKEVAEKVDTEQDHSELVAGLFEMMRKHRGIGLAATQCGITKRVFVSDVIPGSNGVFINPEIVEGRGITKATEGCLSLPGASAEVKRFKEVDVRYWDPTEGAEKEQTLTGLASVCYQHELDHLNGIVFIDHVSKLRRRMAIDQIRRPK